MYPDLNCQTVKDYLKEISSKKPASLPHEYLAYLQSLQLVEREHPSLELRVTALGNSVYSELSGLDSPQKAPYASLLYVPPSSPDPDNAPLPPPGCLAFDLFKEIVKYSALQPAYSGLCNIVKSSDFSPEPPPKESVVRKLFSRIRKAKPSGKPKTQPITVLLSFLDNLEQQPMLTPSYTEQAVKEKAARIDDPALHHQLTILLRSYLAYSLSKDTSLVWEILSQPPEKVQPASPLPPQSLEYFDSWEQKTDEEKTNVWARFYLDFLKELIYAEMVAQKENTGDIIPPFWTRADDSKLLGYNCSSFKPSSLTFQSQSANSFNLRETLLQTFSHQGEGTGLRIEYYPHQQFIDSRKNVPEKILVEDPVLPLPGFGHYQDNHSLALLKGVPFIEEELRPFSKLHVIFEKSPRTSALSRDLELLFFKKPL